MNRILGVALLAAVAAAPVAVEAQTPRAGPAQEHAIRPSEQGSIARMLQQRAELNLTDEQVARLDAIQRRVQEQNAPLVAQLRESGAWQGRQGEAARRPALTPEQREQMRERARTMTPEQREAFRTQMQERRQTVQKGQQGQRARAGRQIPEELRPVAQQIQANTRAGMEEARAVLTPQQQAQLREFAQQRRAEFRNRAGQGRGFRSGR